MDIFEKLIQETLQKKKENLLQLCEEKYKGVGASELVVLEETLTHDASFLKLVNEKLSEKMEDVLSAVVREGFESFAAENPNFVERSLGSMVLRNGNAIKLTEAEERRIFMVYKNKKKLAFVRDYVSGYCKTTDILEECDFPYPAYQDMTEEEQEKAKNAIFADEEFTLSVYDKYKELSRNRDAMKEALSILLEQFGKKNPDFLNGFKSIRSIAYKKYQDLWFKQRDFSEDFLKEIYEKWENCTTDISFEEYIDTYGYEGDCYVSFDEFLKNEFLDKEYMKELLTEEEYEDYSNLSF